MTSRTKSICALVLGVLIGALGLEVNAAAQTVFRLYTTLTGNEVLPDMANGTGAQFTTKTLAQYVTQGFVNTNLTTVAALPTCNATRKGYTIVVSDASSPTYNATVTGGSTSVIDVICNGTNWTAH